MGPDMGFEVSASHDTRQSENMKEQADVEETFLALSDGLWYGTVSVVLGNDRHFTNIRVSSTSDKTNTILHSITLFLA
jgi:hypothetical protein